MSKITEIELPSGEVLNLAEEQIYVGDTEPTDENIELFIDTSENDFIPFGLTKAKNYSTEEQVVGTWIDGKPIYQKTYKDIPFSNETDNLVQTNIGNITFINFVVRFNTENALGNFSRAVSDTLFVRNNNLYYYLSVVGWSTFYSKGDITIQYTKTTDSSTNTPIEATLHRYDEEEKIVGTWFGKPLYEKSIEWSGSNTRRVELDIGVTNITFKNAYGFAKRYDGTFIAINTAYTSTYGLEGYAVSLGDFRSNGTFDVQCGNSTSMTELSITIQYTKITN